MIKNLRVLLFLIMLPFFHASYGQITPSIQWQKCLGGSDNDGAKSINQTSDGGYVIGGNSFSNDGDVSGNHGNSDCWIVKLDSNGNLQWQKSLGGDNYDLAYSIQETIDGGFIFAGRTNSNNGDVSGNHGAYDYWVVKLDISGNVLWQKCLGGSEDDEAYSIQQTIDEGYVVAGFSASYNGDITAPKPGGSDYWIVKLDYVGNIVWEKSLGGSSADYGYSIQETMDGGFVITGDAWSNDGDISGNHGGDDFWITKVDSSGNIVWENAIGGSNIDYGKSIHQTSKGEFIAVGASHSNNGDISTNNGHKDYLILKLDTTGNLLWEKSLGGTNHDVAFSLLETSDGYIINGYTLSNDVDVLGNHGVYDAWVVKIDSVGNVLWKKSLGGSSTEYGISIANTLDGEFVIAGEASSNDGDVSGNHGGFDFWVVKMCEEPHLYYSDADSDGFGNINDIISSCIIQTGYVINNTDCDDTNPYMYPGATELTNGIDDDCDGTTDESCSANFYLVADTLIAHHYWGINTTTGILPLHYNWNWGDGSFDTIPYPGHTYSIGGFYDICLSIQDSIGCIDTTCLNYELIKMTSYQAENTVISVTVVPNIQTSSSVEEDQQQFLVFPNPVNSILTIDLTSDFYDVTIRVYDLHGRLMELPAIHFYTTVQINTSSLPDGFYTLQIINNHGGKIEKGKFVKGN
jgi:hypothetical protein